MIDFLAVLLGAALANNLVLDHLLGVGLAAATTRKIEVAAGMAVTSGLVMVAASVLGYLVHAYVLSPGGYEHLQLLVFVLLILAIVSAVDLYVRLRAPSVWESYRVFLPLTVVNSGVLGAVLVTVRDGTSLWNALCLAAGLAAGFALVLVSLAAIRSRLEVADVPAAFRGLPIALVSLGLMAMAALGF
jgi:electron transport complex protein RnfA